MESKLYGHRCGSRTTTNPLHEVTQQKTNKKAPALRSVKMKNKKQKILMKGCIEKIHELLHEGVSEQKTEVSPMLRQTTKATYRGKTTTCLSSQPCSHYEIGFTTCMRDIVSFVRTQRPGCGSSPEALVFFLLKRLQTREKNVDISSADRKQ